MQIQWHNKETLPDMTLYETDTDIGVVDVDDRWDMMIYRSRPLLLHNVSDRPIRDFSKTGEYCIGYVQKIVEIPQTIKHKPVVMWSYWVPGEDIRFCERRSKFIEWAELP